MSAAVKKKSRDYASTLEADVRRKALWTGEKGAAAVSLVGKRQWRTGADTERERVTDASATLAGQRRKGLLAKPKDAPVGRTMPECARYSAIGRAKPVASGRTVLSVAGWSDADVAWLGPVLCKAVQDRPGDFVEGRRYVAAAEVPAVLREAGFAEADVARLCRWGMTKSKGQSPKGGRPAGFSK